MKTPMRVMEFNGKFYPQYRFWFKWTNLKSIGECPLEYDTKEEAEEVLRKYLHPVIKFHPVNI